MDGQLIDALYKKAIGYSIDEEIVEYSGDGEVTKRKITTKYYPPDITALKTYIELSAERLQRLSSEELIKEKKRLIEMLKEGGNETDKS